MTAKQRIKLSDVINPCACASNQDISVHNIFVSLKNGVIAIYINEKKNQIWLSN